MPNSKLFIVPREPARGGRAPNNLPAQPTILIGRETEVADVHRILGGVSRSDRPGDGEDQGPNVQLLTLVGPGGVGKTRLALKVAEEILDNAVEGSFEHGVYFFDLAAISDPELVVPAIFGVLQLEESPGTPLVATLKEYLQDKRVLLVLDNFEQILPAGAILADLVASCPDLKLLVTSRSPLRMRMERRFVVAPLALPLPGERVSVARLSQYGSVALFVQRARTVKPDFQLTEGNAGAVVEVCRRVDGLPLAIELVVAHIRVLPPQAILARLRHPLRLLMGGSQDSPGRHHSMRDTIELSYKMLDERQQLLFKRMAVFVGGCALQAAEAVCNEAGNISLERDDPLTIEVLEGVEALVDRSLLRIEAPRQPQQGERDDPWLTMLETVREYALEQLSVSGEADAIKRRHASYYLELSERVQAYIKSSDVPAWMATLGPEHGNLRAALEWLLQRDEPTDHEAALRLILNLEDLWGRYHNTVEVQRWLETALTKSEHRATLLRVKALRYASRLSYLAADYSRAEAWAQEALAGARGLDDETLIAASLNHIGLMAIFRGDYARARTLLEEALVLFRQVGDEVGVGAACINLGEISRYQGDYKQAEAYYKESLSIFRASGRKLGVLQALSNIGHVVCMRGDLPAARAIFVEALELSQELDARKIAAEALTGVSSVILAESGQPEIAATRAAQILGITSGIVERSGRQMEPIDQGEFDRNTAAARTILGDESFDMVWEEGRAMTIEQAIELVTRQADMGRGPQAEGRIEERTPGGLTRREAEVTGLVAWGLTNESIARRLVLSERTVEMHVSRALHKLGLTTRTQLTAWAIHNGLAPEAK